jgi:hypothetical protein
MSGESDVKTNAFKSAIDLRTASKLVTHSLCFRYARFNIKKSYVLPTQCIYVFCVDLRTNSDYLTVQL